MPSLILPTERLVLNAYATLVGKSAGSKALASHQAYIASEGVSGYYSALEGIFTPYSTADLATQMLANLGLTGFLGSGTQAWAEGVLENATLGATRVERMLKLAEEVTNYYSGKYGLSSSIDAALVAAHNGYVAAIDQSYEYSLDSAHQLPVDLADMATPLVLTVSMDDLTGTTGNDTFVSNVVQNSLGDQVNTLGSGDILEGLAGVDTLDATVTAGSYIGGSWSMPIAPETNGIEIVKIEAVQSDTDYWAEAGVYLSAKDMVGVEEIGSVHSDVDLVVQNLTTQGVSGGLADMTIRMDHTSNTGVVMDAANLEVYFDQDYLVGGTELGERTISFDVMNEDAYDDGDPPLAGVTFEIFQFTLCGQIVDLQQYIAEGSADEIKTYAQLRDALAAAIEELKADPSLAQTYNAFSAATLAAIQKLSVKAYDATNTFESDEGRTGVKVLLTLDSDVSTDTLTGQASDIKLKAISGTEYRADNRYERVSVDVADNQDYLKVNIALDKVGLLGDGGELVVGSMYTDGENVWSSQYAGKGINEFDVTVYGGDDSSLPFGQQVAEGNRSSSLAGLHSTGNNLKIVKVVTDAAQTGNYADLTIGNTETNGDLGSLPSLENAAALKDVQIFDASGFKGDLTVFAALTDEIADKYLDLTDTAAPADDNVNFEYTGGTGNDYFNIAIDATNEAMNGAVTREDFTVNTTIAGGAGNDEIVLSVVGNDDNSWADLEDDNGLAYASFGFWSGETTLANWYDNQRLLNNITLDGGEGDDVIRKPGSGDVIIEAGAGNDTVYADNTGDKAVWAFNVESGSTWARWQLDNLQSDTNDSYNLYKADLVVSFEGFEARVNIADNAGVVTDLMINNAIKDAINNDATLSKLLVATDGPANTLVVTSLIDGTQYDGGTLSVAVVAPAASELTTTEINTLSTLYGVSATGSAVAAYIAAQAANFNTNVGETYNMGFAQEGGSDLDGYRSLHTSDNTITGDLGDDVLVLGTGRLSNDTVVYEGYGNGTDSIVHFEASSSEDLVYDQSWVYYGQGGVASAAVAEVKESFTLTLTGTVAGTPGAVTFDDVFFGTTGLTYTPTAGDSAATVATNLAAAVTAAAGAWTATASGSVVTFTQVTGAPQSEAYVDGTGSGAPIVFDGSGIGMVVNYVEDDGVTAAPAGIPSNETFTIYFDDAELASTYGIAGTSIPVLAGESGENIAAAVATATYTGWTASYVAGDDFVTFVSTTAGTNVTDATFTGMNLYQGVVTDYADNYDMIDFTAYGAKAVYVDGALIDGTAATTGQKYIVLTESTTNDGAYTAEVWTEAGATDTKVGTIGVLDFGATQEFGAQNFLL